ncbi:hypothetical protein D3C83_213670 [compost metagenome]
MFPFAILLHRLRIGGERLSHESVDRPIVIDAPQPFGFDDRLGIAPLGEHAFEDLFGYRSGNPA